MRVYEIETIVKEHNKAPEELKIETVILGRFDDISEFVQMMYGTYYIVVSFSIKEVKDIVISKSYLRDKAMEMVRFD